ncbi:unnamed protein product [Cuscuta campestris]|uniref:Srp40 C-terminal domain-containing protein n=1 Tax=Cuscuta campestris TaxID=132261 RepID=A0A484L1Z9_9ASTE|nr:unnamed protein product [Cuscuta campestris]
MANQLTAQQKPLLLHSVVQFLHRNGFSKTLKRLLKEAQIQDDCWKNSSCDLEEVFCKYLDTWNGAQTKSEGHKEQDDDRANNPGDTISKKKKKKHSEGNEGHLSLASEGKQESLEYLAAQSCDKIVEEDATKKEKKKKNKSSKLDIESCANDSVKEKPVISNDPSQTIENGDTHVKDSKKRKRKGSEEKENKQLEEENVEETKRRKLEEVKDAKNIKQKGKTDTFPSGNGHGGLGNNNQMDNVSLGDDKKQSSEVPNDNSVNELKNSSQEKSTKKQRNGSSEPKSLNAFQRVKADEVEFVDDRLRDNSYWAKDGADSGYGAKAQEVLGQVKGRDFRHEKTKKKRGSYRGGQIDLHSHSIKFNYSDED